MFKIFISRIHLKILNQQLFLRALKKPAKIYNVYVDFVIRSQYISFDTGKLQHYNPKQMASSSDCLIQIS